MASSARRRMQYVGLAYWTLATIELLVILIGWNTSLLETNQVVAIFLWNFILGICGFAAFFIFLAYAGQPNPSDRLLFNKEPYPRASATLAALFAIVAVLLVVSTVKIGLASHGWSPEDPSASCANRVSRVIQTSHDKWMRYKCVSHHEWIQINKASSMMISGSSSFIPVSFGTMYLGVSISRGRSQSPQDVDKIFDNWPW